ncbi:hypothetical protein F5Y17DRAFT_447271 [Xylariaceae sp. FL0594]|nr:hypothetical protein F5Y17DRAFT_447271 [Xylariaceae sp. FL0594]
MKKRGQSLMLKPRSGRPVRAPAPNKYQVQIPCHLRPALVSDLPAITEIYNHEILNGYKVMDIDPIKPMDFLNIYDKCVMMGMPFAVAVKGPFVPSKYTESEIIGFALVVAATPGIAGSFNTKAFTGGNIQVMVKPEYRRKKVGGALLDLIMSNATPLYSTRGGYKFVNPNGDQRLFGNAGHMRQWYYLDMQVLVLSLGKKEETQRGEEYQWLLDWLEMKFDMGLFYYEDKLFFDERGKRWLSRMSFRHICRSRDGPLPTRQPLKYVGFI